TGPYPTGVIDWGSQPSWFLSAPLGLFTTQSIRFNDAGQTSASFTFLSNSGLASVQAYNAGSDDATVTISCTAQPDAQATVAAQTIVTINTGWTSGCSTVTLANTTGSAVQFDNLVIFAAAPVQDFTLSATPGSQTVVQGGSTSYSVSVSAVNGFTGAVGFDVS